MPDAALTFTYINTMNPYMPRGQDHHHHFTGRETEARSALSKGLSQYMTKLRFKPKNWGSHTQGKQSTVHTVRKGTFNVLQTSERLGGGTSCWEHETCMLYFIYSSVV